MNSRLHARQTDYPMRIVILSKPSASKDLSSTFKLSNRSACKPFRITSLAGPCTLSSVQSHRYKKDQGAASLRALGALRLWDLCVKSHPFCFLSLTLPCKSCVHDRNALNSFRFMPLRTAFIGTEGRAYPLPANLKFYFSFLLSCHTFGAASPTGSSVPFNFQPSTVNPFPKYARGAVACGDSGDALERPTVNGQRQVA